MAKWIVIISAILWAGANITSTSIFYMNQFDVFRGGFRDLGSSRFYEALQIVSSIGYSFTVGATAIYVVLWLEGRRER